VPHFRDSMQTVFALYGKLPYNLGVRTGWLSR
jgi:hypothetical protein